MLKFFIYRHVFKFIQRIDLAVKSYLAVSGLDNAGQDVFMFTLFIFYDWRQNDNIFIKIFFGYLVNDLVNGVLFYFASAFRTMGNTDAGEEQAHIIIDLGDRADGGAGIMRGGFLVYRDRRRQTFNRIHVRLIHQPDELPGVS